MNPFDQFDTPQAAAQGGNPFDQFDAPKGKKTPKYNEVQSGIAGIAQGGTANFGDEMMAGLMSPVIWAGSRVMDVPGYSDMGFGDIYSHERKKIDIENQRASEDNPLSYGAGYLTGAVGTGVAGAATKTGGAVANSLRNGEILGKNLGLAGRVIKGAAAGSTSGALYGAGGADEGKRLEGAGEGAFYGGVAGGAIPVAGAVAGSVGRELKSLVPASPQTSQKLRAAASPFYEKFTKSGATYSAKLTDEVATLADAAKSQGIAGATKKADEALNDALDYYSSLRGKALSPSDIQKLDQSFADDIARFNKAGEYNFGRILNNLKYEFRQRAFDPKKAVNYISGGSANAVRDLTKGNKLWAQSYKAKDMETILAKARGTENPQTSIRTGLKNLLANDKKMALYNDAEKAALRFAMKRGYTGGLVKLFGGRLTDSLAGGIAGGAAGGPAGAIGGAVAGKAVGGVMADVAGGIQANRLRGAMQGMQKGNLPIPGKAISPLISAPAGAIGANAAQPNIPAPRRQPAMTAPAAVAPPMAPQSNNLQAPANSPADLFSRVIQAESQGQQLNKNGNPLISPKGAVGIAQVMPKTGPEAAKLAGVEWDPKRFYMDAEYNAALGNAYLGHMQKKYNNDLFALMAYNWGPGNVDRWIKGGMKPAQVPGETRAYVARILGG
jgi:hypothetical protein